MSVHVAESRSTNGRAEAELLARLGLRPGVSNGDLEAAHDEILDFLAKAPSSLRGWARDQVAEIDEAYSLLNGATPAPTTTAPSAPLKAPTPSSKAQPPTRPAATAQVRVVARNGNGGSRGRSEDLLGDALGGDDLDSWVSEDRGATVVTRRDRHQAPRPQARTATPPAGLVISRRAMTRIGIGGGLVAAVAVVILGVFQLGGGTVPGINGTPAPQATAAGLDVAAVAADMQKLQTNPKDIATLQDLANLYYAAGDYATARTWLDKVLLVDPKNVAALLGYGAAAYNVSDYVTAEAKWRAVLAIDANNIEAHYDLGFMYFSLTPPNIDGARAEWTKVLALNPDDNLKTYISAHLASLDSLASGQPTGSPAPAGSGAPAASPAGSAAPAASPAPTPAAS